VPWRNRFWYSRKIGPGIRLNLSKSGPSLSIGPRGLKLTIGHGQIRRTFGIPGTGLWWTNVQKVAPAKPPEPVPPAMGPKPFEPSPEDPLPATVDPAVGPIVEVAGGALLQEGKVVRSSRAWEAWEAGGGKRWEAAECRLNDATCAAKLMGTIGAPGDRQCPKCSRSTAPPHMRCRACGTWLGGSG